VRLSRGVELRPAGARLHAGGATGGIDGDPVHRGKVDHEPAVTDCRAGGVMAAASDGDQQTVRAGEVHGALHIGRVDALGDEAGSTVDHAVPDAAGTIIAWCARPEQATP